ncbi:MAG: hypothetical protein GYB20_10940 [Oceanospirillales bacterium]|nr:hypothetical protein [Oceanospirillales bacterium]MBR9888193.1 hypothetical protein [Oceanospirillales bacterium]
MNKLAIAGAVMLTAATLSMQAQAEFVGRYNTILDHSRMMSDAPEEHMMKEEQTMMKKEQADHAVPWEWYDVGNR